MYIKDFELLDFTARQSDDYTGGLMWPVNCEPYFLISEKSWFEEYA